MDNQINAWLYDIVNAIDEIDSFFIDNPKILLYYKNDVRTRRAVERNIEIIGEAMNRILKLKEDVGISNARNIVDIRNRIILGYDTVSDEIIWSVVVKYLPILKIEVIALLPQL